MSVISSVPRRALVGSMQDADELALPRWEVALAVVALFLSTNAVMPVIFGGSTGSVGGPTEFSDPITRKAWLLVIAALLVALARVAADTLAAAASNLMIVALAYLVIASAVWSVAPSVTLKDGFEFAFSTLLGLYLGTRFGLHRLVTILSWTTLALLVLSIVFALALPHYGLDATRGDAWRGVFGTKNGLGRMTIVGFAIWGVRTLAGEQRRARNWLILLTFAITAFETDSRTAWGVGGLMIGVFVLARTLSVGRWFLALKGLIVTFLALCVALFAVNLKVMVTVVGSDYSLTGRSGIWQAVWNAIQVHPWLGYGFDAFWDSKERSFEIARAARTETPHAHDGFLDLLLSVGFVGLVCFVIAFVVVWRRALVVLREDQGRAALFPFAYLSFLILYNLTESSLLGSRAFEWIVFVAVAGALARVRRERPARAARPFIGRGRMGMVQS
jgi:O-antigen ligase